MSQIKNKIKKKRGKTRNLQWEKRIAIYVDKDLHDSLEILSEKIGVKITTYCRSALKEYIKDKPLL